MSCCLVNIEKLFAVITCVIDIIRGIKDNIKTTSGNQFCIMSDNFPIFSENIILIESNLNANIKNKSAHNEKVVTNNVLNLSNLS